MSLGGAGNLRAISRTWSRSSVCSAGPARFARRDRRRRGVDSAKSFSCPERRLMDHEQSGESAPSERPPRVSRSGMSKPENEVSPTTDASPPTIFVAGWVCIGRVPVPETLLDELGL